MKWEIKFRSKIRLAVLQLEQKATFIFVLLLFQHALLKIPADLWCVCEEVGGHETSDSANLPDVEAVIIHVSVHLDDVSGAERELHLSAGSFVGLILTHITQLHTFLS